jgi:hypothetical protein
LNSYPAVFIFCFFPNTVARWLYFTDNPNDPPPPYQFTLFGSSLYGLSGVFNLIVFYLTRPSVVVGRSVCPEDGIKPIHRRHDSKFSQNFLQTGPRLDYDHGLHSLDIENFGRPCSTLELQSPSRTMHRTRSSYDLQGINSLPSSPAINIHRSTSSDILDIR